MRNQIQFTARTDFSEFIGNDRIVSSSIGPYGEAVLLGVAAEYEKDLFATDEKKGFAIFPRSKSRRPYPATFFRFDGRVFQRTQLTKVDSAFPFVQPLPNEEILIVGARCRYGSDGNHEKNATVYDPDGTIRRQFVLGDGINGVQTTTDGMIWVSYFDEGVCGNLGWDKPIGAAGLVCFDSTGQIAWEFQPPAGVDVITDCYAFNVAKDSVWACYYTRIPCCKNRFSKAGLCLE